MNPDIPFIVTGDNNQGKTNFLEAIYFISKLSSPREKEVTALIQFDQDESKLGADFLTREGEHRVYIKMNRELELTVELDHQPVKSMRHYRQKFGSHFITADVIRIFTESPDQRRRDLGQYIGHTDPEYAQLVTRYQRIMRQRNVALYQVSRAEQLQVWNTQLSQLAAAIVEKRLKELDQLQVRLNDISAEIGFPYPNIELKYLFHQLKVDTLKFDPLVYAETLIDQLNQKFEKERYQGVTLLGPHRDDFEMWINGRRLSYYSRGINRVMAFMWKLAQIDSIETSAAKKVLLLDEPFAEIDTDYRRRLIGFSESRYQIILATIDDTDSDYFQNAQIARVSQGTMTVQ